MKVEVILLSQAYGDCKVGYLFPKNHTLTGSKVVLK